jgi:hypothetical protein
MLDELLLAFVGRSQRAHRLVGEMGLAGKDLPGLRRVGLHLVKRIQRLFWLVVRDAWLYAALINALVTSDSSLLDLVEAVRALPYGRPSDRSVEGMLRERRGTCSTKHLFLARTLAERFSETEPLIVHRVYRLDRTRARELFDTRVAEIVPEDGLVDVHRYLTIVVDGRRITVDATFPGPPGDGRSSLPLACGPGRDDPAGEDPDAEKRALEVKHCDPEVREPFIAALASVKRSQR